MRTLTIIPAILIGTAFISKAADLIDVQLISDQIIRLTFDEGYIRKHTYHEDRDRDSTFQWPLDLAEAHAANNYTISSSNDKNYENGVPPTAIGRKSKGHDFSKVCKNWYEEPWPGAACKNDYIPYHFIYLQLPYILIEGKNYRIDVGELSDNIKSWSFSFTYPGIRSAAVHVNQMGYKPDAISKYAYISHWMGDLGPFEDHQLEGRSFTLYSINDQGKPGEKAFHGKIEKQKDFQTGGPDRGGPVKSVKNNFVGADVWQADFSSFRREGEYILCVEGIGSSYPFRITKSAYFEPFYYAARAMYFERSTIGRESKYANEYPNPPWENRHVVYTRVRTMDLTDESGNNQKQHIFDQIDWDFDISHIRGWYHDAGDWDGYFSHFKVPRQLMLAYELNAENFIDGELNIPEAQALNGYPDTHIPDILDEAVWLVDYFKNNVGPTGGIFGSRAEPDISKKMGLNNVEELEAKGFRFMDCREHGLPSWEDCTTYIIFGEDPRDSYTFANIAAQYAFCLEIAESKTGETYTDIIEEYKNAAINAYNWAEKNTRPGDLTNKGGSHNSGSLSNAKIIGAAWLYKLTGNEVYHKEFEKISEVIASDKTKLGELKWAAWAYASLNTEDLRYQGSFDKALYQKMITATYADAGIAVTDAINANRSMRMGGLWDVVPRIGQGTTPKILPAVVSSFVATRNNDAFAEEFRKACELTSDYFLGGNGLNFVWLTGVGHEYPKQILHHDSEYYPGGRYTLAGVAPYGQTSNCDDWFAPHPPHPHAGDKCYYDNSHDADFAMLDGRLYPDYYDAQGAMQWPVHELYFDNYGCPPTNEFTIHQSIGPSIAAYGFLKKLDAEVKKNQSPDIVLNLVDTSFESQKPIQANFKASDSNGWVYQIKLYCNNRLVAVSNKAEGNLEFSIADKGEYKIWAEVSDNLGLTSSSETFRIVIH